MNVIDARSGRENLKPGDVVDYGPEPSTITFVDARPGQRDGVPTINTSNPRKVHNPNAGQHEWWKLLAVRDLFLAAWAKVEYHQSNGQSWTKWVPLRVRFTHPGFPNQRVAFTLT